MKKTNKKGFTIVELVIVIAVIAVLAAVLIPTFSGAIGNAKDAAAEQGARNAYTQYSFNKTEAGEDMESDLIYVADGRWVVIANGQVSGTFETEAEALASITPEDDANADTVDAVVLDAELDVSGLWTYKTTHTVASGS